MGRKWWTGWIAIMALRATTALADEPRWASEVMVNESVRTRVEATPVVERPYRPFHFYGNTVRRMHYRGTPVPSPSDVTQGMRALTRRPYVSVESQLP